MAHRERVGPRPDRRPPDRRLRRIPARPGAPAAQLRRLVRRAVRRRGPGAVDRLARSEPDGPGRRRGVHLVGGGGDRGRARLVRRLPGSSQGPLVAARHGPRRTRRGGRVARGGAPRDLVHRAEPGERTLPRGLLGDPWVGDRPRAGHDAAEATLGGGAGATVLQHVRLPRRVRGDPAGAGRPGAPADPGAGPSRLRRRRPEHGPDRGAGVRPDPGGVGLRRRRRLRPHERPRGRRRAGPLRPDPRVERAGGAGAVRPTARSRRVARHEPPAPAPLRRRAPSLATRRAVRSRGSVQRCALSYRPSWGTISTTAAAWSARCTSSRRPCGQGTPAVPSCSSTGRSPAWSSPRRRPTRGSDTPSRRPPPDPTSVEAWDGLKRSRPVPASGRSVRRSYSSITTRTLPSRARSENDVISPSRRNTSEIRLSPTARLRTSTVFSQVGRCGLFTVSRFSWACAEITTIAWSIRNGAPAAHACGEQATG